MGQKRGKMSVELNINALRGGKMYILGCSCPACECRPEVKDAKHMMNLVPYFLYLR